MTKKYLGSFFLFIAALSGCKGSLNESSDAVASASGCVATHTPFGGGDGSLSTPYLICSIAHLQNVYADLSKNYQLTADIDLTGVSFLPIGADDVTGLTGVFDGNNKTISNWTYTNAADAYAVDLFRRVSAGGVVKSLILDAPHLTGNNQVAAIAGFLTGEISHVTVKNANLQGKATVAGIAAHMGAVTDGGTDGSAALVDYAAVLNSTIFSSVTGTANHAVSPGTSDNDSAAAGIVGVMYAGGASRPTISHSAALNNAITFDPTSIYAQDSSNSWLWSYAGGIAGFVEGNVVSCISSGTVTGYYEVGGIVGTATNVSNSMSSAVVTGQDAVGGTLGIGQGIVTNNYSLGAITANGAPSSLSIATDWSGGGFSNNYYWDHGAAGAPALTAAQLIDPASYVGFDFAATWKMPTANPNAAYLSPVPAWTCGLFGITCP